VRAFRAIRTMHQVAPNVWVGSQADFEQLDQYGTEWPVLFGSKEPWHRQFVGYTGRSAPDGPDRLVARNGNRMALNLIDGDDPKYVTRIMIDAGIAFLDEQVAALQPPNQAIIVCNQGQSRSPSLALLWLAPTLSPVFEEAEAKFRGIYPDYAPKAGIREFARIHWRHYHSRTATGQAKSPAETSCHVDTAQELWRAFCRNLETRPSEAAALFISSMVQALENAGADRAGPEPEPKLESD
jgi:hypothetical protein